MKKEAEINKKEKNIPNKKEIKEVQLEAAKVVLKYCIDNKITLPAETQKYVEAYNTNKLEKVFLKK